MSPSKIQEDDPERSNDTDGAGKDGKDPSGKSSAPGLNISTAKATVAVSTNHKTDSHITSIEGGDHFSGTYYLFEIDYKTLF
jgi:hypothetical protein